MFLKDKWKLKCEWWEKIKQKNSIPKGGGKEWAIILNAYQQRTLLLAFGRAKGHCKESQKSAAFQSTLLPTLKSYVYIASRGLSRGIWKSLLCFFSQRQGEYIFPYKNKESWKKFLRSIVAPGVLPWGIPMPSGAGWCLCREGSSHQPQGATWHGESLCLLFIAINCNHCS